MRPIDAGWRYARATGDLKVREGGGVVHAAVLNPGSTAGTVTLYDGADESGTVMATFTVGTTAQVFGPVCVTLDVAFSAGLYVGFDDNFDGSVTVAYA